MKREDYSRAVLLTDAQVSSLRCCIEVEVGWKMVKFYEQISEHGKTQDSRLNWAEIFEKILAPSNRRRIPMQPYHRVALTAVLQAALVKSGKWTELELIRFLDDPSKTRNSHLNSANSAIPNMRCTTSPDSKDKSETPHQVALREADVLIANQSFPFDVRHDANEEELFSVWELDHVSYGDACWPFEVLKERWEAFPHGCQSVFLNGVSVGSFGFWPLTRDFACRFEEGQVGEEQITAKMLIEAQAEPVRFWYFSGVEVQPELRRSPALKRLLSEGLRNSWNAAEVGYPCAVYGCAFSDEGRSLLLRFGFSYISAPSAKRSWPLYRLKVTSSAQFDQLLKSRGL